MSTETTKATPEQLRQYDEVRRQSTATEVTKGAVPEGSHALDHLTVLDNHEAPDTNSTPAEDIAERDAADLSFWNNSWTWVQATKSYGNEAKDKWFINPTAKLIGEVLHNAPVIFNACRIGLETGSHTDQLNFAMTRHIEFLQAGDDGEIISESLDMLKSYQSRFVEEVQRYLGVAASYESAINAQKPDEERIEKALARKEEIGGKCREWACKLIALVAAYHTVITDERAYKLSFDFNPKQGSREAGLLKFTVTNTLNAVGRRLARSIKDGKMDANAYSIPVPWTAEQNMGRVLDANAMLSDFG